MSKLYKLFFILMFLVAFTGIACFSGAQEYGGGPIVFIKPVRAVISNINFILGKSSIARAATLIFLPKKQVKLKKEKTLPWHLLTRENIVASAMMVLLHFQSIQSAIGVT